MTWMVEVQPTDNMGTEIDVPTFIGPFVTKAAARVFTETAHDEPDDAYPHLWTDDVEFARIVYVNDPDMVVAPLVEFVLEVHLEREGQYTRSIGFARVADDFADAKRMVEDINYLVSDELFNGEYVAGVTLTKTSDPQFEEWIEGETPRPYEGEYGLRTKG